MPNSIGERVKECRLALGMSQKELAEKAGLKQPTISALEKGPEGGGSSTSGSLASIAHALNVSALWLETGMGSKELSKARGYRKVYKDGHTGEEYEIRLLDSKGSCGDGKLNFQEDIFKAPLIKEARWFDRYHVKPEEVVAIYADGDSMANFIVDGDIVIFTTNFSDVRSGEIYVVDTPDGLRIKRLHKRVDGTVVLSSDNPDKIRYPDEYYTAEQASHISIMGKFIYRQG